MGSLAASMEITDKAAQTPLHWAAKNGRIQVVKLLVKAQANLEKEDTVSQTPGHLASWQGKEAVVTLLLNARMDIDPEDLRVLAPAERLLKEAERKQKAESQQRRSIVES